MESKSSLQVPLLLKLGESKRALMSATKSGDTDLIYTVLLQLKETTQLADFQMIIRTFPTAQNLYKKYCHLNSKSALQEIFNQEDDFVAQAEFALREGIAVILRFWHSFFLTHSEFLYPYELFSEFSSKRIRTSSHRCWLHRLHIKKHIKILKLNCAKILVNCWKIRKHSQRSNKQRKNLLKILEFGIVINLFFIRWNRYTTSRTQTFYGLSVHETIKRLLILGDLKNAEKKRTEYKVPDKRFWWLRIQVLSETFQWDELDKFSKAKKSPIGYEPFVEVCLKQNNIDEARKYLPKCRNDKKVKWYIRAG